MLKIQRLPITLKPDQTRVLLRPFSHGDDARTRQIIHRILSLQEAEVVKLVEEVLSEFSKRHGSVADRFKARFEDMRAFVPDAANLTPERQLLIGAYFMAEYSLESAALFNPSIVSHPDQSGLASGQLRFILSLRATGEGHISSITFRTGIIHEDHRVEILQQDGFLTEPSQIPNVEYEKPLFTRKLQELGLEGHTVSRILARLDNTFTLDDLRAAIDGSMEGGNQNTANGMWMLAKSNFAVQFASDLRLEQRVIFPSTPSQRNGIEDARFVQFDDGLGGHCYYATFTAYDGRIIMPELLETADFQNFRFITLNGPAAKNKGMALFPKKIGGKFAMLARQDGESIYLMYSDNLHFWNHSDLLLKPTYSWEIVQIGNCGSPIETEAGWLVLSHGVGPTRTYCIGAFLLDLEDPSKVIGVLDRPLIEPNEKEREGYVPNVVYTCGGILHNGMLIVPYGLGDHATGFATVPIDELLRAMRPVAA